MSLVSAMSTALTGMSSADAKLDATANNIANLDTPGYTPTQPDLVSLSDNAGVAVAGYSPDSNGGPDLPTELVNLKQSATLYKANAQVVRASDQMLGTLLDVMDDDRHHDSGDG